MLYHPENLKTNTNVVVQYNIKNQLRGVVKWVTNQMNLWFTRIHKTEHIWKRTYKYLVKVQNITKEHKYNSKCQLQNKYFPSYLTRHFVRDRKKLRDKINSICSRTMCFNKQSNHHKCSAKLTNWKMTKIFQYEI